MHTDKGDQQTTVVLYSRSLGGKQAVSLSFAV